MFSSFVYSTSNLCWKITRKLSVTLIDNSSIYKMLININLLASENSEIGLVNHELFLLDISLEYNKFINWSSKSLLSPKCSFNRISVSSAPSTAYKMVRKILLLSRAEELWWCPHICISFICKASQTKFLQTYPLFCFVDLFQT